MGLKMVEGLAARASAATWLLGKRLNNWDLAVVVAGEPHSAAEAFWHGVDPGHPLHGHDSAPFALKALEDVYRATDRFVATLVEEFDPPRVVVFSMGGMGPNQSDVANMVLLPELVYRWATHKTFLEPPSAWSNNPGVVPVLPDNLWWDSASPSWYPQASPRAAPVRILGRLLPNQVKPWIRKLPHVSTKPRALPEDAFSLDWQPPTRYRHLWPSMAAFVVPSFYGGRVRVNLRGRERDGVVEPTDYEFVLDELESLIRACRDPRTGAPVVSLVERHGGEDPMLLQGTDVDLTVEWSRGTCAFEHPQHGLIGPVPYRRTGGHTGLYGFAFIAGGDIEVGDCGICSAFDVAPTVVELMGSPPLEGMSGSSILRRVAPSSDSEQLSK
jgi:predicted AlkP superfamily phosphohydrolase/phosphomutase